MEKLEEAKASKMRIAAAVLAAFFSLSVVISGMRPLGSGLLILIQYYFGYLLDSDTTLTIESGGNILSIVLLYYSVKLPYMFIAKPKPVAVSPLWRKIMKISLIVFTYITFVAAALLATAIDSRSAKAQTTGVPLPFDRGVGTTEPQHEALLRCGGLLSLLNTAAKEAGVATDATVEEVNAILHLAAAAKLQAEKGDEFIRRGVSQEYFETYMMSVVAVAAGAYSDVYGDWVNESNLTADALSDENQPIMHEYKYCLNMARLMIQSKPAGSFADPDE